jgi:hypothetical protein
MCTPSEVDGIKLVPPNWYLVVLCGGVNITTSHQLLDSVKTRPAASPVLAAQTLALLPIHAELLECEYSRHPAEPFIATRSRWILLDPVDHDLFQGIAHAPVFLTVVAP